jgi:hypothetical protein
LPLSSGFFAFPMICTVSPTKMGTSTAAASGFAACGAGVCL